MNTNTTSSEDLERLRRAAAAIQKLQAKLDAVESTRAEPIAVVGLGCRFPGCADAESYWRLLSEGRDAVSEVPPSRWDNNRYFDPDPRAPGKIATRYGGFVEGADLFDANFFGISPREAVTVDPQQRLLLEVAWEALEHAGIQPDTLKNSASGVFVGISGNDFADQFRDIDPRDIDHYMGSGNARSVASGRLSFILGFKGPSLSIDTACSSSLVAVHLACESLRRDECTLALAAGVNLLFTPEVSISHSRAQMLARDGRCKTFDASADGFIRSEGCGVVVLKRLSHAVANRDNVLAVILGSAVNHDGRTSGLTVPSGPSQESVIRAALARARVDPLQVGFLESHGTGTRLGDPIEAAAFAEVLCKGRSEANPLFVGAVKSNFGHLEAAAGIAGLIKAVLALKHREIPPNLHFHQPNPVIAWDEMPVRIPVKPTRWNGDGHQIAGVSSFGFSGTNAHVILRSAPEEAHEAAVVERMGPSVLVLSAKTEKALQELSIHYAERIEADPAVHLTDIAFSAVTGRSHFQHRLAVVADTAPSCAEKLRKYATRDDASGVLSRELMGGDGPRTAFLFTGQGSQYAGMGLGLYQSYGVFRDAIDKCDELLRSSLDRSLKELLFELPVETLSRTGYTQPALFALEYSLAQLWRSWGIEPEVLLGHSVGEYAAACIAGVFSLEDGLMLIATRARLMQSLKTPGDMVALLADEARVNNAIRHRADQVAIAAVNGPRSVVLSGAEEAVGEIVAAVAAEGVQSIRLPVSHAFHSPLMRPMLAEFRAAAASVRYSVPSIPLISNLTGTLAGPEIATADYWCRHVLEPVRFAAGIECLEREGCETFVEIGPKPVLIDLARQTFTPGSGTWVPSLRPGRSETHQILESLSTLYLNGAPIDWKRFYGQPQPRRVSLPLYPFQRQRYWPELARKKRIVNVSADESHPLLGQRQWNPGSREIRFETRISADSPRWCGDHKVHDVAIFPASGYLEMALEAGSQVLHSEALALEDVSFRRRLMVDNAQIVQIVLDEPEGGLTRFRIFARAAAAENDPGTLHATGTIRILKISPVFRPDTLESYRSETTEPIIPDRLYDAFLTHGVAYGPAFRAITSLWRSSDSVLASVEAPALAGESKTYRAHPVLLDACSAASAVYSLIHGDGETRLQVGVERLSCYRHLPERVWARASVRKNVHELEENWVADIEIFDENGNLCVLIEGQSARTASRESLSASNVPELPHDCYELNWIQQNRQDRVGACGLAAPEHIAASLRDEIAAATRDPELVRYGNLLLALDRVATAWTVNAFQNMGWAWSPGEQFSTRQVARDLGVADRHSRLLERLLSMLEEAGYLSRRAGVWEFIAWPVDNDPVAETNRLSREYPEAHTELTLVADCGSQLADVLRGASDPLGFLFPKGEVSRIATLYEDSPGAVATHTVLSAAVATAVNATDSSRMIRILEIGGGTGATTASILASLPAERVEYTFTDVSSRFLTHAQARFGGYSFIQYRVLDIEQNPSEQGFSPDAYDLVIATNVLHATEDLRTTLGNVHQLLAPGGTLMVLEGTTPSPWIDLVFGMLEGWWRFTDTDLRASHPLLSAAAWKQLLAESGFEAALDVAAEPDVNAALSRQAFLVSVKSHTRHARANDVGHWAILEDAGGLAEQVRRVMEIRGQRVLMLTAAESVRALGNCDTSLRGILDLRSLDIGTSDIHAISGAQRVLELVQTIVRGNAVQRPRLWLVTRDAQHAAGSTVSGLASAPLWGLGKVIALEHPELWGGLIDLSVDPSEQDIKGLVDEILAGEPEDQIAFREGHRYVARIVRRTFESGDEVPIRSDAAYLVTGGFGALGLQAARWLANRGARNLALVGRSGAASPEAQNAIRELRNRGVNVGVFQADVSNASEISDVFTKLAEWPPLRGIIHAAGVPAGGALADLGSVTLRSALEPKVTGTLLLEKLTEGMPLDFFVLCSSMVAMWGARGQGDYVAANQFLDAFAHRRRALNQPALSINWGPLEGAGMLRSESIPELKRMGVTPAPMVSVGEMLGRLLGSAAVQTAPVTIDWRLFRGVYEGRSRKPLFEQLTPEVSSATSPTQTDIVGKLRIAPSAEAGELLMQHAQSTLAGVLGLPPGQLPDTRTGFFDMGVDSLTAMEFRDRLESSLGIALPATLAFDYSNIETLTRYLLSRVADGVDRRAPDPRSQGPDTSSMDTSLVAMLESMTDGEVEALLLKKLETM